MKNKTYPCKLKKATVTSIYKREDPELPENYRPISITWALSKVFEKLLYKQVNEYLIPQKLLSNTQFGFRTTYSTIDPNLYCTEAFRKAINHNKTVAKRNIFFRRSYRNDQFLYHQMKPKNNC